ncbi:hypothetical protein O3P69_003734 [Scylla paramamosain]|uniref:Uncharacterized protein n=1 Tax=Scylla paramamosain TaxID=85552 RepID=A0AAW0UD14_SCYPA
MAQGRQTIRQRDSVGCVVIVWCSDQYVSVAATSCLLGDTCMTTPLPGPQCTSADAGDSIVTCVDNFPV